MVQGGDSICLSACCKSKQLLAPHNIRYSHLPFPSMLNARHRTASLLQDGNVFSASDMGFSAPNVFPRANEESPLARRMFDGVFPVSRRVSGASLPHCSRSLWSLSTRLAKNSLFWGFIKLMLPLNCLLLILFRVICLALKELPVKRSTESFKYSSCVNKVSDVVYNYI